MLLYKSINLTKLLGRIYRVSPLLFFVLLMEAIKEWLCLVECVCACPCACVCLPTCVVCGCSREEKRFLQTSKNAITGPASRYRSGPCLPGEFMISKARPWEIGEIFCLPEHTRSYENGLSVRPFITTTV